MQAAVRKKQIWELALTLLVVGSIWGMLEMTLGGFLHAIHHPQKGAVMGGVAIALMAFFTRLTGKPGLAPLLGVTAALFKPFSALLFGVPLLSPFVVNPSLAIILEALAFSVVAIAFKTAMKKSLTANIAAGFLAGPLGLLLYATAASYLGLGMWATLDFWAKIQVLASNAWPLAAVGSIMFTAGARIGSLSTGRLYAYKTLYPRAYYLASLSLVFLCWTTGIFFGVGA